MWGIFTLCGAFLPCAAILIDLVWTFSLCVGHLHLMWGISPSVAISTSHVAFPPHMGIFTLCGHFHLMWGIYILCGAFSPCMAISTSCGAFSLHMEHFSPHEHLHLTWIFVCSSPGKKNIFTSHGKNSQNNEEVTPIPPIKYLYEPPKNVV